MIDYDAEIERILGGPPSKLAFRALCAALLRAGSPRPELAAFLTHLDMEQLDDDGDDSGTDGSDDERARYDFRAERAVRHAEFIAEAQNFARRMIEGDVGWPPPLMSDAS